MTLASDALAIARRGIRAVDPTRSVRQTLRPLARGCRVGRYRIAPAPGGVVHLVALGKAAGPMLDAAVETIEAPVRGLAVTPRGYPAPRSKVPVVFGDHPVPRESSRRAGEVLLDYVRSTQPEDAVVFLVSGGGSAVAEVPTAPLSVADLARTTEVLLASGAPIGSMNAVRRHLSEVKGGRLARATVARKRATLAVSDVVGDPPSDIASGPTVGDPTTYSGALREVRRFHLEKKLPPRVVRFLRAGARGTYPETPKPRESLFRRAPFVLVATNRSALEAAAVEAQRRGYSAVIVSDRMVGETQPVARAFARRLVRAAGYGAPRPVALLAGGETTVTLGPHPGRGGRNQEFALSAAAELAGAKALVLSVGTDGIDGPTDAAGGWTDGRTIARARARGVDLEAALEGHSAYRALERLGGLVRTGPTGTNVMDLHVGLTRPSVSRDTGGSSRPGAAPSSRRRRS